MDNGKIQKLELEVVFSLYLGPLIFICLIKSSYEVKLDEKNNYRKLYSNGKIEIIVKHFHLGFCLRGILQVHTF